MKHISQGENKNELTIESMALTLKQLEVELKLKQIKSNGGKVIAFFPRHFKRPSWIVELLTKEKIQMRRSSYIEDSKFYLLDTEQFHYLDDPNLLRPKLN